MVSGWLCPRDAPQVCMWCSICPSRYQEWALSPSHHTSTSKGGDTEREKSSSETIFWGDRWENFQMCPASLQGWESGSHMAAEIILLVLKPISGSPCIANSCLSPAVLFLSLSPAQGLAEGVENHFRVCGGVSFLSSMGKKICRLKISILFAVKPICV